MMWRDIPGYEGIYRVSEDGAVESLPRAIPSRRHKSGFKTIKGRMLRGFMKDGIRRVYRLVRDDGDMKRWYAHHLVALAFIGPWPEWAECVRHLDDDPLHNHYHNLAYGTIADNVADSIANGTFPRGEASGHAKLTANDVADIRAAIKAGRRGVQTKLAAQYGVAESAISKIKHGLNWAGAV